MREAFLFQAVKSGAGTGAGVEARLGQGGREAVSWVKGPTKELARNNGEQRLDILPLSPQGLALVFRNSSRKCLRFQIWKEETCKQELGSERGEQCVSREGVGRSGVCADIASSEATGLSAINTILQDWENDLFFCHTHVGT